MRQIVELNVEEKALIAAARDGHEPTDVQRARVRRALDARLAAGAALGAAAYGISSVATAAKITAGVVVVTALAAGSVHLATRSNVRPPTASHIASGAAARSVPAPAPVPIAAPVAADPAPVAAEPAPIAAEPAPVVVPTAVHRPAVAPVIRHEPRAATRAPAPGLGTETALLAEASAAVKSGDIARATRLLHTYDRSFRPGVLAEERAATGVLVLCAAGHLEAARAEARRFAARWPHSPLLARVDGSCAGHGAAR